MEQNLERFITAQEHMYETALVEIIKGKKVSHWMWYIFPQLEIGKSDTAKFFAIKDIEEAKAYLTDLTLGSRLIGITHALLKHTDKKPEDIFGTPDDLKLRSCLTLFSMASKNADNVFATALKEFFDGKKCEITVKRLTRKLEL